MTNQSLLPVTQKDREAYLSLNMLPPEDADAVRAGKWDSLTGMQVLARHRLDHTAPANVDLRWEGDEAGVPDMYDLYLGEHKFGGAWEASNTWRTARTDGKYASKQEAMEAEEQSVRDWLARAGLGRPVGEPVAWMYTWERRDGTIDGPHIWLERHKSYPSYFVETPLYAHPPTSPTADVVEALRWFMTGEIDVSGTALIYDDPLQPRLAAARAALAKVQKS